MPLPIPSELNTHVKAMFVGLRREAAGAFPRPNALSTALMALTMPPGANQIRVAPAITKLFATASVDMWLRAVHSLLLSAAMTRASPIWSSVAGYYSSHYAIRAIAHLLGYYHLYRSKRVVRIVLSGGAFDCTFDKKQGTDREHKFYWKVVRANRPFANDLLFPENNDVAPPASDVSHRSFASYADTLQHLPQYSSLDITAMRNRLERISEIEVTSPPIPDREKFPDLDSVQIVAYHRLIRYRRVLDEIIGPSDRFWGVHRHPQWARGLVDYQQTEDSGLLNAPTGG